jgi:hypothetical protein
MKGDGRWKSRPLNHAHGAKKGKLGVLGGKNSNETLKFPAPRKCLFLGPVPGSSQTRESRPDGIFGKDKDLEAD